MTWNRIATRLELSPDPSAGLWATAWIEIEEALDEPYVLRIELTNDDVGLELDGLVGVEAALELEQDGTTRRVTGIVQHADYRGTHGGRLHTTLTIVPAWSLLQHTQRSRCFHDLTVPEIVERVAAEHLPSYGRTLELARLHHTYERRDLCTQFRETDLQFVTRLLAEEGIVLTFDCSGEREVATLIDDNRGFSPIGAAEYEPADEPPLVPVAKAGASSAPAILSAGWTREVSPRGSTVVAWDWRPKVPERSSSAAAAKAGPSRQGVCEVDERRRLVETDDGVDDYTPRLAELSQARLSANVRARMRSTVLEMTAGGTFAVDGHPHPDMDRAYLVVRALHRFEPLDGLAGSGHDTVELISDLSCQPMELAHRPPAQPRPQVPGIVTARVVGPPGEDIHTDAHGRVLVQLQWGGDAPTCYARVAQAWAGPGFGTLVLPRVGMEVVVSFLDANPDRPLVTGCVYNGANPPPVDLPERRTQTTLRTRTSPSRPDGPDGFNELRFEDAAGAEQIFIHAQRDLVQQVRGGHRRSIGGDQTLTVGGGRKSTVEEDDRIVAGGTIFREAPNRLVTIGPAAKGAAGPAHDTKHVNGKRLIFVEGLWQLAVDDPSAGHETTVETRPTGMTVEAEESIHLCVKGGSSLVITKDAIELVSPQITLANPDSGARIRIAGDVEVSSAEKITVGVTAGLAGISGPPGPVPPDTALVLNPTAATLTAPASIDAETEAGAKLSLSQAACIAGVEARVEGASGSSHITAGAGQISAEAATVSIDATGPFAMTGKPISLN